MRLEQDILAAFPQIQKEPVVTDEFIENNENILELDCSIDHFKIVPAYMLWCLTKKDEKLVDIYTVNALAEYGRTKIKDKEYYNFKWRCSEAQIIVVEKFLRWCLNEINAIDEEQIKRALKHWS